MKKRTAWIGTIISLLLSSLFLYIGISTSKLWLIILSSTLEFIYIIALIILIIDYFQTRSS